MTLSNPSLTHARVPTINDFSNYSLGALGENGLLFACASSPESPSRLDYKPFERWASNHEWSVKLNNGEDAICIAAGMCILNLSLVITDNIG